MGSGAGQLMSEGPTFGGENFDPCREKILEFRRSRSR